MSIEKLAFKLLYKKYEEKCNQVDALQKELEKLKITEKGKMCSVNGNKYEKDVYNVVSKCLLNDKIFNTQKEEDLGGSTISNDIECNYKLDKDIGIEIKKFNSPDWMQCSIKHNIKINKWEASKKGKIPKECQELFNNLINDVKLFNNKVPPFFKKKITHEEWLEIKKKTNDWNDYYFDIPDDTIKNLYKLKGCKYIQISDYGLYHLGKDVCEFDIPEFKCKQQIRVRTKIHNKKNKNGYCNLSVIIACQPKDIKQLTKSSYSLDNSKSLPKNLIYKE